MARVIRPRAGADRCLLIDGPTDGVEGPPARGAAHRGHLAAVLPAAAAAALLDAAVAHVAQAAMAGNGPTVAWTAIGPHPPSVPSSTAALQRCRRALAERPNAKVHVA